MHRLIISADDFGQSPAIDAAIVELILAKKISATSCLVMSPRFKDAARLITPEVRAQAAIGLHLDFTLFANTYSHPELVARTLIRSLSKKAIEATIHAQLNAFEQTLCTPPDYIDGHQHVHQLPQIRDVLLQVLAERYKGQLPWIRISKPPRSSGIKGMIIRTLGSQALENNAIANGFDCSGDLLGVYDFNDQTMPYYARLNDWLSSVKKAKKTPALMCHPAVLNEGGDADDEIYPARVQEYEAFKALNIALKLVKSPVEL